MNTRFNQVNRNKDNQEASYSSLDVFSPVGRPLGKGTATQFYDETLEKAHQYVLFNCDALKPCVE